MSTSDCTGTSSSFWRGIYTFNTDLKKGLARPLTYPGGQEGLKGLDVGIGRVQELLLSITNSTTDKKPDGVSNKDASCECAEQIITSICRIL